MDTPAHTRPAVAEPPLRRLRRQLTRQILTAVAEAVAGRTTEGEAAALIVASADIYAAVVAELEGRSGHFVG